MLLLAKIAIWLFILSLAILWIGVIHAIITFDSKED